MQEVYDQIYELAKPYLNTRQNDVHVENSYRFARILLQKEPGEAEIVYPAILCHDVGWIKLSEDLQRKAFGPTFDPGLRRIHEEEGVKLARRILQKVNYPGDKINEILEIIDGHDSRLGALSDNDRIVKDADKLFRFHPIGLEIDIQRFGVERYPYMEWLSAQIESWFFTATGKSLARSELAKSSA